MSEKKKKKGYEKILTSQNRRKNHKLLKVNTFKTKFEKYTNSVSSEPQLLEL